MMRGRLLAFLLHRANARPPMVARREFYALKDRLLERYATVDGDDVQIIEKECWGHWMDNGCRGPTCMRCAGTGVFETVWVLLRRYRWGPYIFHRPVERAWSPRWGEPSIVGRVQHADYGRSSSEATLWLYLLTAEWALLRRSLRATRRYRIGAWPLLNLQRVVFELHALKRRRPGTRSRAATPLDQELPF